MKTKQNSRRNLPIKPINQTNVTDEEVIESLHTQNDGIKIIVEENPKISVI